MTKAPDVYAVLVRLSFSALCSLPETDSHRSTWPVLMAKHLWGMKREVGRSQQMRKRSCRYSLGERWDCD